MTSSSLQITVLVENSVFSAGLKAEHGLCLWLDMGSACVLFDTGQTGIILENARALGIEIDAVDTIALSHGHYDHTGGLAAVLARASQPPKVFMHPNALQPKFHCVSAAASRAIGMPRDALEALQRCKNLTTAPTPVEVAPGLFLTGEVPRIHPEENVASAFYLDAECARPDPLLDDQSLFMDTPSGLVVMFGCAHAGAINTLTHIRNLVGNRPIRSLIGGMHLHSASPERLAWTIARLREFSVANISVGHCTGAWAVTELWHAFKNSFVPCATGTTLTF